MSVTGKAAAKKILRGKLTDCEMIYMDAYELAALHGFEGTIEEWLASIKGEKGFSPTVEVVDMGDGNLVKVTDDEGMKTFAVMHGETPTISITKTEAGHRVSFSYPTLFPPTGFEVLDGVGILRGDVLPTDDASLVGKLFMDDTGVLSLCFMYDAEQGGCLWAEVCNPAGGGGALTGDIVQRMIDNKILATVPDMIDEALGVIENGTY